MIRRTCYTTISIILFLFLTVSAVAQTGTTISVKADRTNILIGEQIKITLEADVPENEPIRFFQIDSLPHFEFIAREKIDTTNTGSGTRLRQIIHITSFDSGHWVIPALVLGEGLVADSIPIDVGFSKFDSQQPYHDVKDIIEVKAEEKKKQPWWWYAAGGGVLLIILLYFLLRKKKKPVVVVPPPPIDPYKDAMDQLEKLRLSRPEVKQYYSGLVDIFRIYLDRKKGIHSLQQTTEDLVKQLKPLQLPAELSEQLSQSLRLSDFVKYAKYVPSAADDESIVKVIKTAIEFIEQKN